MVTLSFDIMMFNETFPIHNKRSHFINNIIFIYFRLTNTNSKEQSDECFSSNYDYGKTILYKMKIETKTKKEKKKIILIGFIQVGENQEILFNQYNTGAYRKIRMKQQKTEIHNFNSKSLHKWVSRGVKMKFSFER